MSVRRSFGAIGAIGALIAILYVIPLFVPDPSLVWASDDEVCCHVPTIKAIQQEDLRSAVTDYKHYRSATTPLYHLTMAVLLGRVDTFAIRLMWIIVTLAVGALLYQHVRTDMGLHRGERAAVALAFSYLASPTIRASALYFVTDGLAVHLAIASLVVLSRARARPAFSIGLGLLAVVVAFSSFYTRQYYLWVALYVAYEVFVRAPSTGARLATVAGCALLSVPAIALFVLWGGFTPPIGWAPHTHPALSSTVPNVLALLAVYSLPLVWSALTEGVRALRQRTNGNPLRSTLLIIGGAPLYLVLAWMVGFEVPRSGGILRVVDHLGAAGSLVFLVTSYVGLVMLLRWLVVDGLWQAWWATFLLPLLTGSILQQRYFEPAVLIFMFLAVRSTDGLKVLDSRLVWFYPIFAGAYALSRAVYFAGY
jgi:hypothetical protein